MDVLQIVLTGAAHPDVRIVGGGHARGTPYGWWRGRQMWTNSRILGVGDARVRNADADVPLRIPQVREGNTA
ncbi:hypothetical protein GCM10018966_097400 [Streptomyces yanii]